MTIGDKQRFDAAMVGTELPPLVIPVTVRSVVSTAIATRDFQDVHHDTERAKELGSPQIFMNILTSNGYVERYIGEWAGPSAQLKAIKIRLGVSNYPGDVMTMTGEVTDRDEVGRTITVSVTGNNERGVHVSGSAKLQFPEN